jgi:hypothetical protein
MTTLKQRLCELADLAYDKYGNFNSYTLDQYEKVGGGSTRRVYKIEHNGRAYAIKFALWEAARRYNRREARYWNTFHETTRRMMARVHAISTCGRVLAMELVPKTCEDAGLNVWEWNRELRMQLENSEGFTDRQATFLCADNFSFNVGVRANGDIVWIDYAQRDR